MLAHLFLLALILVNSIVLCGYGYEAKLKNPRLYGDAAPIGTACAVITLIASFFTISVKANEISPVFLVIAGAFTVFGAAVYVWLRHVRPMRPQQL